MISEIKIKNFKSIADLTLRPGGSVTVLIGENGSGKSNILEAIAFAAAASANKLDDEFLFNRGIRVTDSDWMISGFAKQEEYAGESVPVPITLSIFGAGDLRPLEMQISRRNSKKNDQWRIDYNSQKNEIELEMEATAFGEEFEKFKNHYRVTGIDLEKSEKFLRFLLAQTNLSIKKRSEAPEISTNLALKDFLIYAPENSALRNFESEGAIKPLGPKGEGLLKLLQNHTESNDTNFAQELKKHLKLLGWFADLALPTEGDEIKGKLRISDCWLSEKGGLFDQRSVNEGFLYLLFYFTLFLSKQTPSFFAIDNLDNSLNPKLCAELMRQLAALAAAHGKQVICTTHNPAILDGLNLHDDNQRLYVVRRNSEGHTVVNRVKAPRPRPDGPPVKLSTAFMSGLLGGLPDHF